MGHEADVQPDRIDAQQPGEIGNLLHLHQPSGPRGPRHEPHGFDDGGDRGIAFALEAAEDDADADAQQLQPGQELLGVLFGAGRFVRGVELDRRHAQFMGHFQFHAQAGVDAGKHAQRPLVHSRFLPMLMGGIHHSEPAVEMKAQQAAAIPVGLPDGPQTM